MQNNNTAVILDDLQIAQVEALANYLSIEQVAGYFNLSASDFLDLQKKDERVLRAYRKGKIRGVCKVALLLWEQMEAGNVTALIFFLKTRGGWSERPFAETEDNAHKFKNIKLICKEFEAEKAKARMEATQFKEERAFQRMHHSCLNDDPRSPVTYPPEEKGKTLEILAKQADVSYGQLFQYNKVLEKGSEEDKLAVRNKEISIKGAFQKIQKAERLETNKVTEWPKVFIPIPLGVMVTKEATEVMARL